MTLSSSLLAMMAGLMTGCRDRGDSESLFVYCTAETKAHAAAVGRLAAEACGRRLTVASLGRGDLVTALRHTLAGDVVLTCDDRLVAELEAMDLALSVHRLGRRGLSLVSTAPRTLEGLAASGSRLGVGTPEGVLGRASGQVLGEVMTKRLAANVTMRSERCDELLRLVRAGTLDAAIVWRLPVAPEGLHATTLGDGATGSDLVLVRLRCSRLPERSAAQVVAAMTSAAGRDSLAGLGVESGLELQP